MGLSQDEALHRKERTGEIDSKKTLCVRVRVCVGVGDGIRYHDCMPAIMP